MSKRFPTAKIERTLRTGVVPQGIINDAKKVKKAWQVFSPAMDFVKFVSIMAVSFFEALVTLVWGMAGIFLLITLLGYYHELPNAMGAMPGLFNMINFVQEHYGFFFLAFWILAILTHWHHLDKKEK